MSLVLSLLLLSVWPAELEEEDDEMLAVVGGVGAAVKRGVRIPGPKGAATVTSEAGGEAGGFRENGVARVTCLGRPCSFFFFLTLLSVFTFALALWLLLLRRLSLSFLTSGETGRAGRSSPESTADDEDEEEVEDDEEKEEETISTTSSSSSSGVPPPFLAGAVCARLPPLPRLLLLFRGLPTCAEEDDDENDPGD